MAKKDIQQDQASRYHHDKKFCPTLVRKEPI